MDKYPLNIQPRYLMGKIIKSMNDLYFNQSIALSTYLTALKGWMNQVSSEYIVKGEVFMGPLSKNCKKNLRGQCSHAKVPYLSELYGICHPHR